MHVCMHVHMYTWTYVHMSSSVTLRLRFWGRVSHLNQELSTLASLLGQLASGIPHLCLPVHWDHRLVATPTWILRGFWGSKHITCGSSSQPSTVTFSSVSEMAIKWTNRPGWTKEQRHTPREREQTMWEFMVFLRVVSYLKPSNCFCNFLFNMFGLWLTTGRPKIIENQIEDEWGKSSVARGNGIAGPRENSVEQTSHTQSNTSCKILFAWVQM